MFWERFSMLCDEMGKAPNAVCKELRYSNATPTHWKSGKEPKKETLEKVASYFNVSVPFLLGYTEIRGEDRAIISDDDLKFALFNGSEGVTDEMFDEVKQFAQMVKMREDAKRKENK